jgi:hypothetical protein
MWKVMKLVLAVASRETTRQRAGSFTVRTVPNVESPLASPTNLTKLIRSNLALFLFYASKTCRNGER